MTQQQHHTKHTFSYRVKKVQLKKKKNGHGNLVRDKLNLQYIIYNKLAQFLAFYFYNFLSIVY